MFVFVLPLLVMFGLLFLAVQLGSVDSGITSAYNDLQRSPNDPLKDHAFTLRRMYADRESLRVFFSYYIPGIAYLVFLRFLPEILGLTKRRRDA